jgi:hypothetical protein
LLAEDFLSEEAGMKLTKKDRVLAFGCVILGGEINTTARSDSVCELQG